MDVIYCPALVGVKRKSRFIGAARFLNVFLQIVIWPILKENVHPVKKEEYSEQSLILK
jgi:hypothetical protein